MTMNKLFQGTINFKNEDFEHLKEHFENLGKGQSPHTLFIGCSDSRVVPNMITKTMPGDIFVVRNIANIVPPYRRSPEYLSTTSAIEYAVQVLNVENIVVCGHSNCGGCNALFQPAEFFDKIPNVANWLDLANDVKNSILENHKLEDLPKQEWLVEQMNVVEQVKNLATYPFIKRRVEEGSIKLFGWYYIIQTGEVFNYNAETSQFELLNPSEG